MSGFVELLRNPRGGGGARLVLGLGVATVWLVLAAVVGAIAVGDDDGASDVSAIGGPQPTIIDPNTGQPVPDPNAPPVDPATGQPLPGPNVPAPAPDPNAPPPPPGPAAPAPAGPAPAPGQAAAAPPPPTPGDRTGVTDSIIKVGVHAPITFSGVPLNLAEDPIKGLQAYVKFLNDNGGINGRKIQLQLADDRFDTPGAQAAANALINDGKNFVVSGTLGIDQVAVVAAEAARRGVPYTAAGGAENVPIPGMYQLATSYTTHVEKLAEFIAVDPNLRGKRVGILVSDSQYIKPVAEAFKRALEAKGQAVSTIVANQKPAQNPNYDSYIAQFIQARTEVLVPLTDPLTTQQIVQRCAGGVRCTWTYSFSNFAHDSDTALALMTPTWSTQRVRGLSGACYYQAPEVNGPNCAAMRTARDQYVAVNGQRDWDENGSGAASGYQIVAFLKGALAQPGADLTRERFRGALAAYNNYSDLITGPITFAGSRNTMRGATRMTVLEAQTNNRFRMITPGFVDGF